VTEEGSGGTDTEKAKIERPTPNVQLRSKTQGDRALIERAILTAEALRPQRKAKRIWPQVVVVLELVLLLCRFGFPTQVGGKFLDFGKVALHFAPAVPQGVIGVCMEGALESAHAVFEVHNEEFLLNYGGRVMEGEQVGERAGICLRFLEHTVLIESGNDADGFGHEVIGLLDHVVALRELLSREIAGVAPVAYGQHLIALLLPVFVGEFGEFGVFDDL
jgi:hypothetical protein